MLNQAPYFEGMWGNGVIAPRILLLGSGWGWVVPGAGPSLLTERKKIPLLPLPGTEPQSSSPWPCRYTAWVTLAPVRAEWLGVRIPKGAGNFSLHHRVQTGSGAHPPSYPVGKRNSFPGGKAAGAWSWVPRSKNEWSYTSNPAIRLSGVVLS